MAFHLNGYSNFHEMNLDWLAEQMPILYDAKDQAVEAAEEAEASADRSEQQAANAATSALNAAQSALGAAQSATDAADSAQDASDTVSNTLNQINLLQSRVDNIIPEGTQTEGNTELLDIRVGAHGDIYASAGDAVRDQILDIENILALTETEIEYALHPRMIQSSGNVANSNNWAGLYANELLYVLKGSTVTIDNTNLSHVFNIGAAMYTENNATSANLIANTVQLGSAGLTSYIAKENGYLWFGAYNTDATAITNDERADVLDAIAFNLKKPLPELNYDTNQDQETRIQTLERGEIELNIPYEIAGPGYVNGNTGTVVESHATLSRTDYISVNGESVLRFPQYFSGSSAGYAFYTAQKSFISGGTLTGTEGSVLEIEAPASAKFIAVTVQNDHISDFYIKEKTTYIDYINQKTAEDDNPLADHPENKYIQIFNKIGVIGDSLASGYFNAPAKGSTPAGTITRYEYSWIQQIAKRNGIEAINFSSGGQSTRSWLQSIYAGYIADGEHDCEAFYIALCHNDYNDSVPVGTPSDIGTENDTFYGNYARIISLIQTYYPCSKIFVITAKDEDKFGAYNTAIRYMPNAFTKNVYVLDMAYYGGGTDVPAWMKTGAHGNAAGYLLYSHWIENYTDWFISNNQDQFAYVQLINTNLQDNIPDEQTA